MVFYACFGVFFDFLILTPSGTPSPGPLFGCRTVIGDTKAVGVKTIENCGETDRCCECSGETEGK